MHVFILRVARVRCFKVDRIVEHRRANVKWSNVGWIKKKKIDLRTEKWVNKLKMKRRSSNSNIEEKKNHRWNRAATRSHTPQLSIQWMRLTRALCQSEIPIYACEANIYIYTHHFQSACVKSHIIFFLIVAFDWEPMWSSFQIGIHHLLRYYSFILQQFRMVCCCLYLFWFSCHTHDRHFVYIWLL